MWRSFASWSTSEDGKECIRLSVDGTEIMGNARRHFVNVCHACHQWIELRPVRLVRVRIKIWRVGEETNAGSGVELRPEVGRCWRSHSFSVALSVAFLTFALRERRLWMESNSASLGQQRENEPPKEKKVRAQRKNKREGNMGTVSGMVNTIKKISGWHRQHGPTGPSGVLRAILRYSQLPLMD